MLALALPECKLIPGPARRGRGAVGPHGPTCSMSGLLRAPGPWIRAPRGDGPALVPRSRLTRFIILFPGRAGGTYLLGALKSHPQLRVKGEPLGVLGKRGADAQLDFLRGFYRGPLLGRARAVGILTKYPDIVDPDRTAALLRDLGTRVVSLERENHVKTAVSIIRARRLKDATGRWNKYSTDTELEAFDIDVEDFERRLERSRARKQATADYAVSLGLPFMRLTYEQLLTDPSGSFAAVFDFLGVDPMTVESNSLKVTSDDLRASVRNFDELRDHYVGTPLEPMFDEVLVPGS